MSEDEFENATTEDLKHRLSVERENHSAEIESLRTEFEQRLSALKGKIERGETERPPVINVADYKQMLREGTPGIDEITRKIRKGEVQVSPDAPVGLWLRPKEKLDIVALLKLPISEYEAAMKRVKRGELEITSERK